MADLRYSDLTLNNFKYNKSYIVIFAHAVKKTRDQEVKKDNFDNLIL